MKRQAASNTKQDKMIVNESEDEGDFDDSCSNEESDSMDGGYLLDDCDDEQFLEQMKVNKARRRNMASLKELTLREVVEVLKSIYPSKPQSLSNNLDDCAKILVLDYAASMHNPAVEKRVYFPSSISDGKLAPSIVKVLINGSLKRFDFKVCEDSKKEEYYRIWECLAANSGSSLLAVSDKDDWCSRQNPPAKCLLLFLQKCVNLETLELESHYVNDDDLEILEKKLTKLVHVSLLFEKVTTQGLKALGRLPHLQSLKFRTTGEAVMGIDEYNAKIMQLIPQLRILGNNGCRSNLIIKIDETFRQPSKLENFCLPHFHDEGFVERLPTLFPGLRFLDIKKEETKVTPQILQQLPHLQFLCFNTSDMDELVMPTLKLIGSQITALEINTEAKRVYVEVSRIVQLCPNLEFLKLKSFICSPKEPSIISERLKLKKVEFAEPLGLQAYLVAFDLLKAPLLEEAKICFVELNARAISSFTVDLAAGRVFKNLVAMEIDCDCQDFEQVSSFRYLLVHILANAPKLDHLEYCMTGYGYNNGSYFQVNRDEDEIEELENAFYRSMDKYYEAM